VLRMHLLFELACLRHSNSLALVKGVLHEIIASSMAYATTVFIDTSSQDDFSTDSNHQTMTLSLLHLSSPCINNLDIHTTIITKKKRKKKWILRFIDHSVTKHSIKSLMSYKKIYICSVRGEGGEDSLRRVIFTVLQIHNSRVSDATN
jgi:hypothetical protein